MLVVNADVTEMRKLEAKFLRSQRMESIGTLAGGIAHDLNNVLSPILMAVGLLRRQISDARGRRILDTLDTSAQRGADMVRQILTFARGAEGERVPLQPAHLIREMQKIAEETFPKSISVRADRNRLGEGLLGDLLHFPDEMRGLEGDALALRPAGERQDLADHVCPPLGARVEGVEDAPASGVADLPSQESDGHEDGGEHVVEIVGDAAGQGPDALHALRAEELGLQLPHLGHVGVDDEHRPRRAPLVPHQRPAALHDQVAAVPRPLLQDPGPDAVLQDCAPRLEEITPGPDVEEVRDVLPEGVAPEIAILTLRAA